MNNFEKNIDTIIKNYVIFRNMVSTEISVKAETTPAFVITMAAAPVVCQATEQQFRAIAIRRIISKLDRRLIPFLVLLEIISYTNRLSISMYS